MGLIESSVRAWNDGAGGDQISPTEFFGVSMTEIERWEREHPDETVLDAWDPVRLAAMDERYG